MRSLPCEPFVRADLEMIGLTRARLRAGLADGSIRQILRGVYVDASLPETIEVRAAGAALVVSSRHVLVDRTAAWIHGVDTYALAELDHPVTIEVRVRRGSEPTRRRGTHSGERDLIPQDIQQIGGISVTSPLRTAMDLGCVLRRREAYAAINELARAHDLNGRDFQLALARYRRRRGVIQLRELVQLIDRRIESPRESWVRLAIHDASLPQPMPQWVVHLGGKEFRLDFAYIGSRVAVEYDGDDHHSLTIDVARDEHRRAALRDAGWRIIVVRSGDFTEERLDAWLRTLRAYLEPRYTARRFA